jgi:dTDP-glucose 4,6-dehydratase
LELFLRQSYRSRSLLSVFSFEDKVVSSIFKSKVEVVIAKKPILGKPAERYVPSVQRAFSELQLKPLISLQDSIIRTIDYASATLL